jgi:hypothetical protein
MHHSTPLERREVEGEEEEAPS